MVAALTSVLMPTKTEPPIPIFEDDHTDEMIPISVAGELLRLIRALVWTIVLGQLGLLVLVGGLAGANLAVQLGVFSASTESPAPMHHRNGARDTD